MSELLCRTFDLYCEKHKEVVVEEVDDDVWQHTHTYAHTDAHRQTQIDICTHRRLASFHISSYNWISVQNPSPSLNVLHHF